MLSEPVKLSSAILYQCGALLPCFCCRGVYWVDAIIRMLSMLTLLPQGYQWQITPTIISAALEILQSGSPLLRPWVPVTQPVTHRSWKHAVQSERKRIKCVTAAIATNLQSGSILTCSVFGGPAAQQSEHVAEQPIGTFRLVPVQQTATPTTASQCEAQEECPFVEPVRKQQQAENSSLAELPWVWHVLMPAAYVLMPMAYIQAALSPLLKRIDLLADYFALQHWG